MEARFRNEGCCITIKGCRIQEIGKREVAMFKVNHLALQKKGWGVVMFKVSSFAPHKRSHDSVKEGGCNV